MASLLGWFVPTRFLFPVIIKRLPYHTDKLISLSVFILLQLMDLLASRKSLQIKFSPGMVLPNMIPFWASAMKVSIVLGKSLGDALSWMVKLCYSITLFV